jgi:aminoglycoside phosphotransferase (APT) family kinase protein
MTSPTQQSLDPSVVGGLVRAALAADVASCTELTGGGFAAVWRVDLVDGSRVVVKVGPRPEVPLLEYEAGMIAAEAEYLRLVESGAPTVPVARVLHYSAGGDGPGADSVDGEWLVSTFLPGTPLPVLRSESPEIDDAPVRRELGAAIAMVHRIEGDRFGYSGDRPHGSTWREAFTAMVESTMRDAEVWGVDLASPPSRVRAALRRHGDLLDLVRRPALLHFDLWDGNVLASFDGHGAPHLTGLVDGERYLFGDPLLDLVSPVILRRIEDEPDHPFLAGYAETAGRSVVLDEAAIYRIALYRMHMHLLLAAEMPSRGMTTPADVGRKEHVARLLNEELDLLGV